MSIQYQKRVIQADAFTPISVFNCLQGKKKFILESSSHHEDKGRYSFIGINPFQEIIGTSQTVTIKTGEAVERIEGKGLDIVKQYIPRVDLDLPYPFYGGAIGYVGYDSTFQKHEIGESLRDDVEMPDFHFMIYQDLLIFDHQKQSLTLIAVDLSNTRDKSTLNSALDDILAQIQTNQQSLTTERVSLTFKPSIDQQTFVNWVKQAKSSIEKGDIFQVVLSQRLQASFKGDPFYLYRQLRMKNPSPYLYFIDFTDYCLIGASPESLVKAKGRQLMTNPIAGTRPRGKTKEADQQLADQLLTDPKELAEHKMLIDLSRHDLEIVCQPATIKLKQKMMIERYQHVMHIVSKLTGELKENLTAMDALAALLPAGTVSGSPKLKAMQLINQLEREKRGVYAGAVGYVNMNGDLDFAIAIRTMVLKNQTAYVQAGAGIIADSDPVSEYYETLNKAKSLLEIAKSDFYHARSAD